VVAKWEDRAVRRRREMQTVIVKLCKEELPSQPRERGLVDQMHDGRRK